MNNRKKTETNEIMDKISEDLISYEKAGDHYFTRNVPIVVRIDGKNFKHLTRTLKKPFDETLNEVMKETLISLCRTVSGTVLGYNISDEINLIIYDNRNYWYNNNIQGFVASIASLVTGLFNKYYHEKIQFTDSNKRVALFDVVAFNLPIEHISDYFIRKQNAAMRANLESACAVHGILKGTSKLNNFQLKQRLFNEKGIDFDQDFAMENRLGLVVKENEAHDYVALKETPLFESDLTFFNDILDIPYYDMGVIDD